AFEGGRPPSEVEQAVFRPLLCRALRHDLLSEDVEGRGGLDDRVEAAGAGPAKQGRALHELVPAGRIQHTPRHTEAGVVRPADPLEERAAAPRGPALADHLDWADVDPQLQGRRPQQGPDVPRPPERLHAWAAC